MQVWSLGQQDPLEKGMATHASILAWRIPWTEEPGRLQSIGHRVRHDWSDWAHTHADNFKQCQGLTPLLPSTDHSHLYLSPPVATASPTDYSACQSSIFTQWLSPGLLITSSSLPLRPRGENSSLYMFPWVSKTPTHTLSLVTLLNSGQLASLSASCISCWHYGWFHPAAREFSSWSSQRLR